MADVTKIPLEQLLSDAEESLLDIDLCKLELVIGVTDYSGGPVADRLAGNVGIVQTIVKELGRRLREQTKA